MRGSTRFAIIFGLLLLCIPVRGFAQVLDDGAAAVVARSSPGYVRVAPSATTPSQLYQLQPITPGTILVFPANALTSKDALRAGNGAAVASGTPNNNAANAAAEGTDGDEWYCQVKFERCNQTVRAAYSKDAHRFSVPSSSLSQRNHQSLRLVVFSICPEFPRC